ncbi:MAG: family 16 glycosylhydrolase [Bacteroidales bacterium]
MPNRNKKYLISILLSALPLFIFAQCYELLWSDEFNYTGYPDSTYWTAEEGGSGWGNNESQYYTVNDPGNAKVENGLLTITALKENYGGRNYTSARLITRGKFNVQYGKVEARMKLPYGQGIWPAFWMMGESITEVGWPACGEIDIMEMIGGNGREKTTHGTLHWDNNGNHAQAGSSYTLESGTFSDDFHLFSIIWTPQSIRWFIDDIQFHVIDITPAGLSEFHSNFFILLNLAVGGNWPGYPDATTQFPQALEVDYVRVYKESTEIEEITVEGDDHVAQKAAEKEFSLPYSSGWTYNWSVPEGVEIISGQDSSHIIVNWGCETGTITCYLTGSCETYEIYKQITVDTEIHGPMFVSENQQEALFYTDSMIASVLNWTVPSDIEITGGQGTDSIYVNWGTTYENISLSIENSCGNTNLEYEVIKAGQYPYPDINTPHSIPGTINAVEFDYGGQDISYRDNTPGNEGSGARQDTNVDTQTSDNGNPNVGWITNGEWLEYTIAVDSASYYAIELRVATANSVGGPFSFHFNGVELLGGITVANTGGWSSFKTIKAGTVYLTEKDTLMRVSFDTGGFNLGNMTFTTTTKPDNIVRSAYSSLRIFPVPASDHIDVSGLKGFEKIVIHDLNGSVVKEIINNDSEILKIDIQPLKNGIYFLKIAGNQSYAVVQKLIKIS